MHPTKNPMAGSIEIAVYYVYTMISMGGSVQLFIEKPQTTNYPWRNFVGGGDATRQLANNKIQNSPSFSRIWF